MEFGQGGKKENNTSLGSCSDAMDEEMHKQKLTVRSYKLLDSKE